MSAGDRIRNAWPRDPGGAWRWKTIAEALAFIEGLPGQFVVDGEALLERQQALYEGFYVAVLLIAAESTR